MRDGEGFSRRSAFDRIPRTIGVLCDLFRFISLGDLPTEFEWIVDDLSEVLAVADAPGILSAYYKEGKGSDPIVHFYEPEKRERRGVYYTPEPVVSYIVRSLHKLLKSDFGKSDGLASVGVTLLDPAAGTMTFVARAAQEAVREFESKYGAGAREEFIGRHILRNFYAFELMMAPYAVGRLKMSFFLEELGHRLADDERIRFYLTNTLDMEELAQMPPAVWKYRIGGYQVCEKWLKDRQERRLELEDICTSCRMVTALKHTIEIQQEVDALYSSA